jgi:hypothetical protein
MFNCGKKMLDQDWKVGMGPMGPSSREVLSPKAQVRIGHKIRNPLRNPLALNDEKTKVNVTVPRKTVVVRNVSIPDTPVKSTFPSKNEPLKKG